MRRWEGHPLCRAVADETRDAWTREVGVGLIKSSGRQEIERARFDWYWIETGMSQTRPMDMVEYHLHLVSSLIPSLQYTGPSDPIKRSGGSCSTPILRTQLNKFDTRVKNKSREGPKKKERRRGRGRRRRKKRQNIPLAHNY